MPNFVQVYSKHCFALTLSSVSYKIRKNKLESERKNSIEKQR